MRSMRRLQFVPSALVLDRATPIDRYLDRDDHALHGRWTTTDHTTMELGEIELALHDSRGRTAVIEPRDGAATIWHLLWVRDESRSRVAVRSESWSIAPGDSIVVPQSAPLQIDGRQLALEIAVPGADAAIVPPTHGEERFFGFNRLTTCCYAGDIRLCRWKLTQPLALVQHYSRPTLVLGLARNAVIRTASEIDLLRQGELALVDPDDEPTISPDDLSYLLTIDRPGAIDRR